MREREREKERKREKEKKERKRKEERKKERNKQRKKEREGKRVKERERKCPGGMRTGNGESFTMLASVSISTFQKVKDNESRKHLQRKLDGKKAMTLKGNSLRGQDKIMGMKAQFSHR